MKPQPKLIDAALRALAADEVAKTIIDSNGKIPNRFERYVASFGGSVVLLGIMPACMALMADKKKSPVGDMMYGIYMEAFEVPKVFKTLDTYLKENWMVWHEKAPMKKKVFRDQMTRVAVSLKLAMRTYEIDDSSSQD